MAAEQEQPVLVPAERPVNLIPVGLKEAALDSPSFRATTVHFAEQVDLVERWLENYTKTTSKLSSSVSTFEALVNAFISSTAPPQQLSEAIIDPDYTLLAARTYGEAARDFWGGVTGTLKKLDQNMVEPVRVFIQSDLRNFKDARKQLEQTQKQLDSLQARYSGQVKTKEPSSLREDAFQLHEARKAYLKASMDFSVMAPQLRTSLDKLLVKVFYDQWRSINSSRDVHKPSVAKWSSDLDRIRGWSREMENGEKTFKRELQTARKQIEDSAELVARPSRELEDYAPATATTTVKGPGISGVSSNGQKTTKSEKQGWLNLRTISGKPARTVWVRRWFFVKNGIFGWLVQGSRSGGVEESERIGVLLCGVRPAAQEERRFCFEVKTKDTTIVLQADSQPELGEWMATFDVAKKKALEDPASTDSPVSSTIPRAIDPAFAISPPSAPEFAASAADAGIYNTTDEYLSAGPDRSATLPVSGQDAPGYRGSFDVAQLRRPTISDKDGETSRDPAARIMQKLDLHRKTGLSNSTTTLPSTTSTSSNASAGGIASLISASHSSLPVGPGAIPPTQQEAQHTRNLSASWGMIKNMPQSTLAPSTLANPPTPTNLSTTAVVVNGERGIGIGRSDGTGGMPSGIMANLWGSSNWGYINRLERGELKAAKSTEPGTAPPSPLVLPATDRSRGDSQPQTMQSDHHLSHRKTISLGGDLTDSPPKPLAPTQEFPNYYPMQLKQQDAQFRLLFPNASRFDKVVLVFRATWNPNHEQDFPGRVYVTAKDIYFYSHHLGLILITGLSLSRVLEVTAAPGRDCDFLFLHLKETPATVDYTRITIKTFLEPLRLLQRRLNFLVHNCNTEKPLDLESVMKKLIRLENQEEDNKSPSLESWEENVSPLPDGLKRRESRRTPRDLRANIFIDQGLFGSGVPVDKPAARFKLPNKPVIYVPQGTMKRAVEKEFNISPKALFHIMFGDRSAVWQLLYHERRAQKIKQCPWVQQDKTHMRRRFEYIVESTPWFGQPSQVEIADTQMIDVLNDHLCYVVTDRKTPWHLPYHQSYTLVSKVVITHVAKSRCKLAIYTKIDWLQQPFLAGALIEPRALADLELDALDLADVISDQVKKLGAHSRTKKAISIFGHVGQQKSATEFGGSESTLPMPTRRAISQRSLTRLFFEILGSFAEDVITSLMMWTIDLVKWLWKTVNANVLILSILALSALANFLFASQRTAGWWQDRSASRYMSNLGIGPDFSMSKSVHLQELDLAVIMNQTSAAANPNGACYKTFQSVTSNSPSTTQNSASTTTSMTKQQRRLHRTREHFGKYRHDLMVAMRVVNSIEKEMLLAEWEDWIREETDRCEKMEDMLGENNVQDGNETEREMQILRGRFIDYCQSCRVEGEKLSLRGMGLA